MKRLFILMCLTSLSLMAGAQNYIQEFGKYTNDELQMQKYEKDPTAEAVVIYDIGETYFQQSIRGLDLIFEHRMKIKILTKAGLKWAEFAIPYHEERDSGEEITEIKGNTYNMENEQVRKSVLDVKTAFEVKAGSYSRIKKFAMPDVKESSVIEISYKISSPYIFSFRNWEFQTTIPVIFSSYTTKMVPFYEYTYILQGASKFDVFLSYEDNGISKRYAGVEYHDMVYLYSMKDLPAFKDESYITSANDYLVKLSFQLSALHRPNSSTEAIMSTWPKLSEGLLKEDSFGKYIKAAQSKSKELIDTMKFESPRAIDKAQKIEHFVKSSFKWDESLGLLASKSIKELLKTKTGNCGDINLFLTGMLNAAGIEAYPVIISTRGHGKINSNYPFLHYFNAVVVLAKLDTLSVLLDATEPRSKFTEIPTRFINDQGLIVRKEKTEWVSLKSNQISSEIYYTKLVPDPEKDSIDQQCRLVSTGYEAVSYRNKYTESYKNLKTSLLGNNALTSDTLRPLGLDRIEAPFEIDFNKNIPLESVEDKIIISPFGNFIFTENPLKQASRSYPVDFIYKNFTAFETTITIPKGYKLLSKPESLRLDDNMVRIIFSVNATNKETIKVIGLYEFKKDEYQAVEYLYLKDYFNKIVNKFNEKLILVKES